MTETTFPPQLTLAPVGHAEGVVALPGSKSISNRTLLLAALARGTTTLTGLLESDDTRVMLEALRALGIDWRLAGDLRYEVPGAGGPFAVKTADLFLGLSGLSMRTLVAALAFSGGRYRADGVPRMRERPIGDLVDALRPLGAQIDYELAAGFPPLRIGPGHPAAAPVRIRGDVSSQFLTGLLQALPLLRTDVTVTVEGELISRPYVDITLNLMRRFGVTVVREGADTFRVPAGTGYESPGELAVEGDASGASYFLAAGALGGGPVRVTGVGRDSIQGDVAFADELARQGADVRFGPDWIEVRAGRPLAGGTIDCVAIPDAAMTFAITALFADAPTTLTGIGSWRVKETDRLAAMATELRKVGATVAEGPDWLTVTPCARLVPATIATYDDHRMAMCFALVRFGGVPVTIDDPACVRKTFPDYFAALAAIVTMRADLPMVITVDGPAASGKGTIAEAVARALGFHYLDSGSLYRLVALKAVRTGTSCADAAALAGLAAALDVRFGDGALRLDGEDVAAAIRSEEVSAAASQVAVHGAVRQALIERQRGFRRLPGLVADGRDMGTVVFPDARLKVFVTASAEERARRRHKQLIAKGISVTLDGLLRDIRERDARDTGRAIAPLVAASDAVLLDTTNLTIDQAVARVLALYRAAAKDA